MGVLGRLFGTKPNFIDRVWRTEARKLRDLVERAREGTCLVVYHFADTGERLRALLDDAGIDYETLTRPGADRLARLSGVHLLASEEIPDEVKRGLGQRPGHAVETASHVHLAEHYPIPSRDDEVLNLHTILARGSRFFCYVGLDEPWLEKVIGDSTRTLLDRLGMSDDEPIEHSMVGSALRRAQEQIDKKRRNLEIPARSSGAWMEKNLSE